MLRTILLFFIFWWKRHQCEKQLSLSKDGHATIYLWKQSSALRRVGHLALYLNDNDKTYISFWPAPSASRDKSALYGCTSTRHTYKQDKEAEGGEPDEIHHIPHSLLDLDRIRDWWLEIENKSKYDLFGNNCALTVYMALKEGGLKLFKPHAIANLGLGMSFLYGVVGLVSEVPNRQDLIDEGGFEALPLTPATALSYIKERTEEQTDFISFSNNFIPFILIIFVLIGGILIRIIGGGLLAYFVFRMHIRCRPMLLIAMSVLALGIVACVLFKCGIKLDDIMEKGVYPMLALAASLLATFLVYQLVPKTVLKMTMTILTIKLATFAFVAEDRVVNEDQYGSKWDLIVRGLAMYCTLALFVICCIGLIIPWREEIFRVAAISAIRTRVSWAHFLYNKCIK